MSKLLAGLIAISLAAGAPAALAQSDGSPKNSAMIIAWHPITSTKVESWHAAGITTIFNLYGDFNWQKVEPKPGVFDFSN